MILSSIHKWDRMIGQCCGSAALGGFGLELGRVVA